MKATLRLTAVQLHERYKYLHLVPWFLVHATTSEGATEIVRQVRSRPLAEHDPATRRFWCSFEHDVLAVKDGLPPSIQLIQECDALANASLHEGVGEGWHRTAGHEKTRAPSSSLAHIKQNSRLKDIIRRCRTLIRKHGPKAKAMIRYEWYNSKRLLQTDPKRMWQPRKISTKAFYRRIYREDSKAQDNWSSIMQRVPLDHPVITEDLSAKAQMDKEWLSLVLVPLEYYSVPNRMPTAGPPEPGADPDGREYFQVIAKIDGRARDHAMHTFESADDVTRTAQLCFSLQFFDRWLDPCDHDDGVLRVHAAADSEWTLPSQLGDQHTLVTKMTHYCRAVEDPEHEALVVLSKPELARTNLPLMDERCPVLCLVHYLRGHGWDPVAKAVQHTRAPLEKSREPFDGRDGCSRKFYFQCLVNLMKHLPQSSTGVIPSSEPQLFYKLLLRGQHVTPGQGHKAYVLQFNRAKVAGHLEMLPLPPPEPAGVPLADDNEEFGTLPLPEPKRKSRASSAGAFRTAGGDGAVVALGGGGGGSSGSGGPAPAPPPLPLPPAAGGGEGSPLVGPEGGGDGVAEVELEFFGMPPIPPAVPSPKRRANQRKTKGDWKPGIQGTGTEVLYMPDYVDPKGKPAPNLKLRCDKHDACEKRRGNTEGHTKHYGNIELIAFLWAWYEVDWPTAPRMMTHAQEFPPQSAVDAIMANHRQELEEIAARCGL